MGPSTTSDRVVPQQATTPCYYEALLRHSYKCTGMLVVTHCWLLHLCSLFVVIVGWVFGTTLAVTQVFPDTERESESESETESESESEQYLL